MIETVTVDEALRKGHRMVNYPVIAILVGMPTASMVLSVQGLLPFGSIAVAFVLGVGLGWLYWSVMITKWRLWAFENVRNVHELRKRAIRENLIWPDGHILNKIEIRSREDQMKWESLHHKFEREDLFHDDPTVPAETAIYYSKAINYFQMGIALIIFTTGLHLLWDKNYIWGAIVTVIGAFASYREYREATNTEPQIILNSRGIQTAKTPFYAWGDISNEEVISERRGRNTSHYLIYDYPGGRKKLEIDDYTIDQQTLNHLLFVYRGRSQSKNSFH